MGWEGIQIVRKLKLESIKDKILSNTLVSVICLTKMKSNKKNLKSKSNPLNM